MKALPPTADVVRAMALLAPANRTAYLQELIGPPTSEPFVLHRRALLVTALKDAHVWPDGCPGPGSPAA